MLTNNSVTGELQRLPKDAERGTTLFDIRVPNKYIDDIIVDKKVKQQLDEIFVEYSSSEILATYGLTPRRKLLFAGPPGCRKTLCAEIVAVK